MPRNSFKNEPTVQRRAETLLGNQEEGDGRTNAGNAGRKDHRACQFTLLLTAINPNEEGLYIEVLHRLQEAE